MHKPLLKNNAHFLLLLLFCLHVTCNFLFLPFKHEKCKQVYKACLNKRNSKDLNGATEFKGGKHMIIRYTEQRQDSSYPYVMLN